jgi:hypothetical protein
MAHQHTPSTTSPGDSSEDFKIAVSKGYEPNDIGLRGIFVFVAGLTATLVVVLAFIYAVMMALADHDRSTDKIASPVAVKLQPVYAPLQPSLGFNGDHDNDHNVLDAQDMLVMRKRVTEVLDSEGTTTTGRRYIPIDSAISLIAPALEKITQPAVPPIQALTYPKGSFEGKWPGYPAEKPVEGKQPKVNPMETLNNQED